MSIEEVREYCLSKPHATEDMPFGDDCVTFRVAGKIFGGISLSQGQVVQMKCSPEEFDELTARLRAGFQQTAEESPAESGVNHRRQGKAL